MELRIAYNKTLVNDARNKFVIKQEGCIDLVCISCINLIYTGFGGVRSCILLAALSLLIHMNITITSQQQI